MAATFQTGELAVIDRRTDSYDFKDEKTGEQVKGETEVLVVHDAATHTAYDVKIKRNVVGLFETVTPGDMVKLSVEVFARGNKTSQTAVGLVYA